MIEFNLDLAAIEKAITQKTRAIIINSPNNPTGQIYSQESLIALGRLLEEAGTRFGTTIMIIADEPYRKIVFEDHTVPSIFKASRNSIVLSSYSKDLSLPGERIGYLAVHPDLVDKASLLDAMTLATRILGFRQRPGPDAAGRGTTPGGLGGQLHLRETKGDILLAPQGRRLYIHPA